MLVISRVVAREAKPATLAALAWWGDLTLGRTGVSPTSRTTGSMRQWTGRCTGEDDIEAELAPRHRSQGGTARPELL